tara:strand:- start:4760 stop:5191 length:432 start_codon:yes stop_codon:yes gene_type:complete
MDTTKIIKNLVIFEIVLFVAYIVTSIYFEEHLSPLLQEYLAEELESNFTFFELIFVVLYIPAYLASIIGLLRTKIWAKNLFVLAAVSSYVVLPFLGPYVDHAVPATIDSVAAAVEGAIVALLLFSSSAFNKQGLGTALQPPQP